MFQSTLPKELEKHTIGHMVEDEIAYTSAGAFRVDSDRKIWIRADYPAYSGDEAGGTVHFRIRRTSEGIILFVEYLDGCKFYVDEGSDQRMPWTELPVRLV